MLGAVAGGLLFGFGAPLAGALVVAGWWVTDAAGAFDPVSRSSTRTSGFSRRRQASTHPADPPPTITKSYSSTFIGFPEAEKYDCHDCRSLFQIPVVA